MSDEHDDESGGQGNRLMSMVVGAPLTMLTFVAAGVTFLAMMKSGDASDLNNAIAHGAANRAGLWSGEWWRLFTASFVHNSPMLLVWNIFMGFSLATSFERVMGSLRFALLFIVGGMATVATVSIVRDGVFLGLGAPLFVIMGGIYTLQWFRYGSWRALWNDPAQKRSIATTISWLALMPVIGADWISPIAGLVLGLAITSGMVPGGRNRLPVALFVSALLIAASLRPLPKIHDGWIDRVALINAYGANDWAKIIALTDGKDLSKDELYPLLRAQALIESNRTEEGVALLPEKKTAQPGLVSVLYTSTGHADRALVVLNEALKDDASDERLLRLKMDTLVALKDDQGLEAFEKDMQKEHPSWAISKGLLAHGLMRQERDEDAVEPLSIAAKKEPRLWSDDYVLLLLDLGRYADAKAQLKEEPSASLSCLTASMEGDFESQACPTLVGSSPIKRSFRALWMVGRGDCESARKLVEGDSSELPSALRALCSVREGDEAPAREMIAKDPKSIEAKVALFAATKDLAVLEGRETEAKRAVLWPLLPEEAKKALPR
ncbi:MAG: rhomboid family intramembrane serine protease [Archangium sp.]